MTDKELQLQKHKRIATGLFFAMALVYLLMVYTLKYIPQNWMGYVKAFAEAAMVGALADWFAVTALFKQPMGLPIPHTNLIVNSKDKIGDNLGAFVTDNFLTSENIRPYIEKVDLANMLAQWLNVSKNQQIIEKEFTTIIQSLLRDSDETKITTFLSTKAKQGIDSLNFQYFAAKGILYMTEKGEHNRLIDLIIPKTQQYIEDNRANIYDKIIERQPLLALVGGKAVTNQLVMGMNSFLDEIAANPTHKLRNELTLRLEALAIEIEHSPQWKQKFQELKDQFISIETIDSYVTDFWKSMKENLTEQLINEHSTIRQYIRQNIAHIASDLKNNEAMRQKINKWIQHTIYRLALKNTKEVTALIRNTVERWDGRELSDKLELEVGKDLQFIRINGTVVGGLVGLLIFIVTRLIS